MSVSVNLQAVALAQRAVSEGLVRVFILDLLGPDGEHPGGFGAEGLAKTLYDVGIDASCSNCSSRPQLFAYLQTVSNICNEERCHAIAIHFFGHGSAEGIKLTEEYKEVSWNDLSGVLIDLHRTMNGAFILCFDVCMGLHGFKLAQHFLPFPFLALIGSKDKIYPEQTDRAYVQFYVSLLNERAGLAKSVETMNDAYGGKGDAFELVLGTEGAFDFPARDGKRRTKSIALEDKETKDIFLQ